MERVCTSSSAAQRNRPTWCQHLRAEIIGTKSDANRRRNALIIACRTRNDQCENITCLLRQHCQADTLRVKVKRREEIEEEGDGDKQMREVRNMEAPFGCRNFGCFLPVRQTSPRKANEAREKKASTVTMRVARFEVSCGSNFASNIPHHFLLFSSLIKIQQRCD